MDLNSILSNIMPQLLDILIKKIKENLPTETKEALDNLLKNENKKIDIQKEVINLILQYNEQSLKELEIKEKFKNTGLSRYVRPILTLFIAVVFNITLLIGLALGKVSFQEYIATLAPINSMLIGF